MKTISYVFSLKIWMNCFECELNCHLNFDFNWVNDCFDEIIAENKRLLNECIFGQKCYNYCVIWKDFFGYK